MGHFNKEINIPALKELSTGSAVVKADVEAFEMPDERIIYLLANGEFFMELELLPQGFAQIIIVINQKNFFRCTHEQSSSSAPIYKSNLAEIHGPLGNLAGLW